MKVISANIKTIVIICVIIITFTLISVAALRIFNKQNQQGKADQLNLVSEEESLTIAREYINNCPTFKFDGMEETLKHTSTLTLRCPSCWQFEFQFESRQSGYGDRTGQMLAQVITHHTVTIMVQEGEVGSAIMDDKWDMIKQKLVESNSEDKNCP